MRYRTLEADTAVYQAIPDELLPDAVAMMKDLTTSVDDLMGLYPSIRRIQAAALALELQRTNVGSVQAYLATIRDVALQSDAVAASAQRALEQSAEEVEIATIAVETATSDVVRGQAIERRAEIVSLQLLDYRNFSSAVLAPFARVGVGFRWLGLKRLK